MSRKRSTTQRKRYPLRSLLLVHRRPAHSARERWTVVFALHHVLCLPVVESEDLVGKVESIGHDGESIFQAIAGLGIDLEVRVEIIVPKRAIKSSRSRSLPAVADATAAGAVLILIGVNAVFVVRQANANRESPTVERRTDVEKIGRLAQKPRAIGTSRQATGCGIGPGVIGGETQTTKRSREFGVTLQVQQETSSSAGSNVYTFTQILPALAPLLVTFTTESPMFRFEA